MNDVLREVAALVLAEAGMVIRESQLPALAAAVGRVEPGLTPSALLARAARPADRKAIVDRLIDEVTIKETFFLRHRDELEAIDWIALGARAQMAGRSTVRVWSAACSSGEEPYSLAVLALEAFGGPHAPVDVLATDIAPSALARARRGHYAARSVRHLDQPLRDRWFEPHGRGGLAVGDPVRRVVRLARHNLVADPVPPHGETPFDVIVCRNVLIYFPPEVVRATIGRLRTALVPGGTLVLGAADRLGHVDAADPPADRRRRERERRSAPRPRPDRRRPRPTPPPAPAAAPALDAEADFERGVAALAAGDADTAAAALRRTLYLDPGHAVAAFQLARAHEARGDTTAARRAYWQALALLEETGDEVGGMARRDLQSVARARLDALGRR